MGDMLRSGVPGSSLVKGGMCSAGLGAQGMCGRFPVRNTQAQPGSFEEGECGSCQPLSTPRHTHPLAAGPWTDLHHVNDPYCATDELRALRFHFSTLI